jgi:hypothetical protein
MRREPLLEGLVWCLERLPIRARQQLTPVRLGILQRLHRVGELEHGLLDSPTKVA